MKIKRKVQKTLPQLIEWGFENDIKRATYMSKNGLTVDFSFDGKAVIGYAFSKDDIFTVTTEEEITEDTNFRHLVLIDDSGLSASYVNRSIDDIKYGKEKEFHAYIDGEFKCIWKKGKLVE